MLVNKATVLDLTKSVNPTEGLILPIHIKVETEPQGMNELETQPDILRAKGESNKIDRYVANTSEGFTAEFPITIEPASSDENANNNSESYPQYIKIEPPSDDADSGEINQNQFALAESAMCLVRPENFETNPRSLNGLKPYQCPFCPKTFITSTRLKEHNRTHTGERPYACNSCSKTYITAASLHIHIRTHMKEKPFVCSECGKSCTTSQLFKYHKRTHTGERPYACTFCSKSYITNGRLQRHLLSHQKKNFEGTFECSLCTRTFKSSWALKVHTRVHKPTQSTHQSNKQPDKLQNDNNPEMSATPSIKIKDEPQDEDESAEDLEILAAKSQTQKLSKEFIVDEKSQDVPETQTNSLSLFKTEESVESIHSSESNSQHELKNYKIRTEVFKQYGMYPKEKPFVCLACGKRFLTTTKLEIHIRSHTGEKPYQCNLCLKAFVSSYKLTEHKRIHIGDKPYECRFCSKTFLRSTEVQQHERTHTKEKPYNCSECGKGFVTSSVLNRHKRIHSGVKPYGCNHCSKTFSSKFYLQTHTRSHTKENLFECPDCGKSFTTSKLLKDHEMTHSGERPYACNYCSKTYINHSGLINHTRSYEKEDRKRKAPYECLLCSKAFKNSCAYKAHALMNCIKQENSLIQSTTDTEQDSKNETHLLDQTEIAIAAKEGGAISRQNTEGISEGSQICFKQLKVCLRKSIDIEDINTKQIGKRLYVCSYCFATFHSNRDFRTHVRNHNKEKMQDFKNLKITHIAENVCKYCSKTYIYSGYMEKHMRKKHNAEISDEWTKIYPQQPSTSRSEVLKADGMVFKQEIDPETMDE